MFNMNLKAKKIGQTIFVQVIKCYKALPVIIAKRMKKWLLKVTYIFTYVLKVPQSAKK